MARTGRDRVINSSRSTIEVLRQSTACKSGSRSNGHALKEFGHAGRGHKGRFPSGSQHRHLDLLGDSRSNASKGAVGSRASTGMPIRFRLLMLLLGLAR